MPGLLKVNFKFSFNTFKCLVDIEIVVNLSFNILNVWSSKKMSRRRFAFLSVVTPFDAFVLKVLFRSFLASDNSFKTR
jgi:hypothetical protein